MEVQIPPGDGKSPPQDGFLYTEELFQIPDTRGVCKQRLLR